MNLIRQRVFTRTSWQIAVLAAYIFVVQTLGAFSVLSDYTRNGLPLESWEPFTWEYSSGVMLVLLLPLILLIDKRYPMRSGNFKRAISVHLLVTVPFSILHVAGMVGIRKAIYWLNQAIYDFGNLPVEMFYEYRKDFISYFFFLFVIYAFRHFGERISGSSYEEKDEPSDSTAFRVRHRGLERVIGADAIDWVEAAGNYVLLHLGEEVHPLRDTMKAVELRLGSRFVRVHRSAIVNSERVEGSRTRRGGRRQLLLSSGAKVDCGRSYQAAITTLLKAGLPTLP